MKSIIFSLLFFVPTVVVGCSFTADADRVQPAENNISKYETIFVGTVIEAKELPEYAGNSYIFSVEKTYKGEHVETRKVSSPGHSCGSFYGEGQVGLFFMNDTTSIDEANPQYFFDSVEDAMTAADVAFISTQVIEKPPVKPTACTKEYRPVCGSLQVQCVTTPCPPIESTYGNECTMRAAGAVFVHAGECTSEIETGEPTKIPTTEPKTVVAPETGPLVGFVEPTTPPPYDNSPQSYEKEDEDRSFLKYVIHWFSGFFPWF